MSRVGNKLIRIPEGVVLTTEGVLFTVKGPLGEQGCTIPASVGYKVDSGELSFSRDGDRPQQRSDHGLARALVNNLIVGVTTGFKRVLELEGTGYKWEVRGREVAMSLGYSHQVLVPIPDGIKVEIRGSQCEVSGINKQLVGFTAAQIRKRKRVEPYKGKGIRYQGEFVRRKAGKAGA
jgi:large subunit ribosomal protein L6